MIHRDQYGDSTTESKVCSKCGVSQPIDKFTPNKLSKGGRHTVCNRCRARRHFVKSKNPTDAEMRAFEKSYVERSARGPEEGTPRWKHLRAKYGLSKQRFEEMHREQGGKCAICGTEKAGGIHGTLVVDHCHRSGEVRGLLCNPCNVALGHFKDDPSMMRRAADYVSGGDSWKSIGALAAGIVKAVQK